MPCVDCGAQRGFANCKQPAVRRGELAIGDEIKFERDTRQRISPVSGLDAVA
jgi:hypothetical protein